MKPSNLLLDHEGRIWLTDFGLARRLDDVTLSMTGALLGTPRYMSPEQASARRTQIDRRTDLYSLGATLYELLTGQPVFAGESPHQVIQQILTTDPQPLRQQRAEIPRDVETVVMKCLAKEAGSRYETARSLADDLRACLERRPIRARRPSPVEQAVRWFQNSRQTVRIAAAAAAATLIAMVSLGLLVRWRDAARQVDLTLTTSNPPLTVEFHAAHGQDRSTIETAAPPVAIAAVPTDRPFAIPEGDYVVRTRGLDLWSRMQQVTLPRGEGRRLDLTLDDQQLWMPVETPHWFAVSVDRGMGALLLFDAQNVTCQTGLPLMKRWSRPVIEDLRSHLPDSPGLAWPWFPGAQARHLAEGFTLNAPWVVAHTVDVNRDGVGDFVMAGRHQAFLSVFSGADGSPLWAIGRGPDLKWAPRADRLRTVRSSYFAAPQIVPDRDADGVPDLLTAWADTGDDPDQIHSSPDSSNNQMVGRRKLELISGASGKSLWCTELEARWFDEKSNEAVPDELRWLVGSGFGTSSGSSGGSMYTGRHYVRDENRHVQRMGPYVYLPTPFRELTVDGRALLATVAGRCIVLIDPQEGRVVRTEELPQRPDRVGEWGDVDGDGADDFVWTKRRAPPVGMRRDLVDLAAWSIKQQKLLWQVSLGARFPQAETWTTPPAAWPYLVDLNGDGAVELLTPDKNSANAAAVMQSTPWSEVEVRDGRTGLPLWTRRLVTSDQQIEHLAAGPDIDGDGWREVYVATLSMIPMRVHVDCLSGRDGTTRWTSSREVEPGDEALGTYLQSTQWWNAGEDGWPQWIVVVDGLNNRRKGIQAFAFSAGAGQVTRTRRDLAFVQTIDVDNDNVEDLITYRARIPECPEDGGVIDCVRGVAAEPWNRLGPEGTPISDVDGDGVRDLLRDHQFGVVEVISGATGNRLWQANFPDQSPLKVEPLQATTASGETEDNPLLGDIDRDGISDLLVWQVRQFGAPLPPFAALSARTGAMLWVASELTSQVTGGIYDRRLVDLEGDGEPELAVIFAGDHDYNATRLSLSSGDLQWWLIVVSARTGRLRWKSPLSVPYGNSPVAITAGSSGATFPLRHATILYDLLRTGDLDGDGVQDLLAPALAPSSRNMELCAFAGSNGHEMWRRPLPRESSNDEPLVHYRSAEFADIEGDGRPEVAMLEVEPQGKEFSDTCVPYLRVLDGATGQVRWSWQGESRRTTNQPYFQGERQGVSELRLVRASNGRRLPAFCLTGEPGSIMVIENEGKATALTIPKLLPAGRVWVCDADGDHLDEVAIVTAEELWLFDPANPEKPRWRLGGSGDRFSRIVGVRSKSSVGPAEFLAVRAAGDNSLVGVDAAKGDVRWRCAAPIPRQEQGFSIPQVVERMDLSMSPTSSSPDPTTARETRPAPRVFFQYNQTSYYREAAWAGEVEETQRGAQAAHISTAIARHGATMAKPQSSLVLPTHDTRWARDLPWKLPEDAWDYLWETLWGGAFLAIVLVILPGSVVVWMIRRRRWGLRTLFGLAALVGVMTLVSTYSAPWGTGSGSGSLPSTGLRWVIALSSTPPLLMLLKFGVWLWGRQFRRAAWWGGGIVVVSLATGSAILLIERIAVPPLPEQHYAWAGWYAILVYGFYLVSVLQLPITLAEGWSQRGKAKKLAPAP